MRAWGKDLAIGFGFAEALALIAWVAGGGTNAQIIVLLVAWPLLTPTIHRARRGSDPTLPHP